MNEDTRLRAGGDMRDRRGGSAGSVLLGMLLGALAGVATALLFAPRSGEETQRAIRQRGDDLRDEAERRITVGRDRAGDRVRQARMTVAEWLDEGSSLLGDQANRIRDNEVEQRISAG